MNEQAIYTVSDLNGEINTLLSENYTSILVSGEISNLSRPASGHLYFSLKDQQAQIRCALFRFQHQQIDFQMENGQAVIVRAQVNIYEPRGDFQLIVSHVQLAGSGKLQVAFEKLKKELEKKGWFDEKHKKSLPEFIKTVGVITSSTGAALQDILKVLRKRAPSMSVIIYPTAVQGENAAKQITRMIEMANHRKECNVLIVARGGGSIEDLWSFNELIVAKAIFESDLPIVTGIGHQTDFTIADFVADVRAPTPSAAAEMISTDQLALEKQLGYCYQRLLHIIHAQLAQAKIHLLHAQKRLQHPREKLRQQAQQLDQLEAQIMRLMQNQLERHREKIRHFTQLLDNLSPLKILQRGYSVTRLQKNNHIVVRSDMTSAGDKIITQVSDGEIVSVVEYTHYT